MTVILSGIALTLIRRIVDGWNERLPWDTCCEPNLRALKAKLENCLCHNFMRGGAGIFLFLFTLSYFLCFFIVFFFFPHGGLFLCGVWTPLQIVHMAYLYPL